MGGCLVIKQLGLGLSCTLNEKCLPACLPAPGVTWPAHPAAAGQGRGVSPKPSSLLCGAEQAALQDRVARIRKPHALPDARQVLEKTVVLTP